MKRIEERVKELRNMGVRHRIIDRVRVLLIPAIKEALDEFEDVFMRMGLAIPELEGRIKALERRLKTLEDEVAYLEEVMAKHGLFKIMAKEVGEDAEG